MLIHNFCRLQEGVNPIHPATASCEANVTYVRYLTDPGIKGGAHSLFRLDIFWVWVAGDPRSKAPSELGYVACTVSIAISEVIQIIGPDLHHFRSLIDERSAVVGPA